MDQYVWESGWTEKMTLRGKNTLKHVKIMRKSYLDLIVTCSLFLHILPHFSVASTFHCKLLVLVRKLTSCHCPFLFLIDYTPHIYNGFTNERVGRI